MKALKGNLGMANTKVYGLSPHELEYLSSQMRVGPKNPLREETIFYSSAVYVMNQMEQMGYRMVTCACQGDSGQPMWTMRRN